MCMIQAEIAEKCTQDTAWVLVPGLSIDKFCHCFLYDLFLRCNSDQAVISTGNNYRIFKLQELLYIIALHA